MPYKIKKKAGGFKVCKKQGGKCFSKKAMTKKKAKSQMAAIQINSRESTNYFETLIESCFHE